MGKQIRPSDDDRSLGNACKRAGITGEEYLALSHHLPALHSEFERIQRDLHGPEKELAYLNAIQWAQAQPKSSFNVAVREPPTPSTPRSPRVVRRPSRINTQRISFALLTSGLLMADMAAVAILVTPGGIKYFGLVLAGLASATFGGLGLLQRYRT